MICARRTIRRSHRLACEPLEDRRLLSLQPVLVRDINTEPVEDPADYFTAAAIGAELLFVGGEGGNRELWRSDGTVAGTVQIAEIRPGDEGSQLAFFTGVGGVVYFSANDGSTGAELWKSDGTAQGTVQVADIRPGPDGSNPSNLVGVGDLLYFTADDGESGVELWKSDGTEEGTVLVRNVYLGDGDASPSLLTDVDGVVFFSATDEESGTELWKSDGTLEGTERVADLSPGEADSALYNLTNVDGTLYFATNDDVTRRLWKSDGTELGTVRVPDVEPIDASFPSGLTNLNGELFYFANAADMGREPWITDGTNDGTRPVVDIREGFRWSTFDPGRWDPLVRQEVVVMGGDAYFVADDGSTGPELWKSDGTKEGTTKVIDINPRPIPEPERLFTPGMPFDDSQPTNLTVVGDQLFFAAFEEQAGVELWTSDGTESGTRRLTDIGSDQAHLSPEYFVAAESRLFFLGRNEEGGLSLWTSDGTAEGTQPLTSLSRENNDARIGFGGKLVGVNGLVYFSARDGVTGDELWRSDGTREGTVRVADIRPNGSYPGSHPVELVASNGALYFRADDGNTAGFHGYELWKANATGDGATLVADIWEGIGGSGRTFGLPNAISFRDALFLRADSPEYNGELWKSDGTADGTVLVKDISEGQGASDPENFLVLEERLLFTADDGTSGRELWATDGTTEGTTLVKDINPSPSAGSDPTELVTLGQFAFFAANDGVHGVELWKTDGTANGTTLVRDIRPDGSSNVEHLTVVGEELYFVADDGVHGGELWKTDGTSEGTTLVLDVAPGLGSSQLFHLTAVNDALFFTAIAEVGGRRLWRSDGTAEGTNSVEIPSGAGGEALNPSELRNASGSLFFSADDATHGQELWIWTEGLAAPTLVADIIPGPDGSGPFGLISEHGSLYFVAGDEIHGRELWKLEAPPGDTNFDGVVDLIDFDRLKANFGKAETNLAGDLNYDDVVDLLDFNVLKDHFGDGSESAQPASVAVDSNVVAAAAMDAVLAEAEEE